MNLKNLLFCIAFAYCFGVYAQVQRPWSLAECIEYAKDHNISIKQQELSIQEAQISLLQAKYDYIPTIALNGSSTTSFGKDLEPTTYEYIKRKTTTDLSGEITASTDLFDGFKKFKQLKLTRLNLQASLSDVQKAKNDMALNVTAAYFEILFAEENIKIAEHKITTLKLQETKTGQLVKANSKTIGDLLQIQAQVAEAMNDVISAHGQKQKAYLNLCQLLEIENHRNFQIIIPDSFDIAGMSVSSAIDTVVSATKFLPEIISAQLRVNIAEKNIAIAKSDLYPTLSLSSGYGSSYADARERMSVDENGAPVLNDQNEPAYRKYWFADQLKDNAAAYISLNLTVPVFNSFRTKHNIKAQRIAKHRAEYDLILAQKQLTKEVEQLFIDADIAFQCYRSSLISVDANEKAFA